jgi:hypothetical protein
MWDLHVSDRGGEKKKIVWGRKETGYGPFSEPGLK